MGEINTQVMLLVDTLKKKKQILEELKKYTDTQKELLLKEDLDTKAFNNIMRNKQVRIDLLNKIDDGFQVTFERVKNILTTQPDIYKDAIVSMKGLIKEVSDLGVEIQVQEERNRLNFEAKSSKSKAEVKKFRNHRTVMKKYRNTYLHQNKVDGPHFFDSKK